MNNQKSLNNTFLCFLSSYSLQFKHQVLRSLTAIGRSLFHRLTLIFLLSFTLISVTVAQNDTRVGEYETKKMGVNYFNYSDPDKANIEVIVLGGVKNPGKYLVPEGSTFLDVMSLTGGLINDRIGDNIKFIRPSEKNGKLKDNKVMLLKYADLFKDDPISDVSKNNPVLRPGDVIAVPIKPEMTTWETIKDVAYVITPLISIGTLIVTILNYYK